jgi:hypothetical protein
MRRVMVRRTRPRVPVLLTAALAMVGVTVAAPRARASTDYNTTIHVPAAVMEDPCVPGDVLNLNGDLHILMTTTASGAGYKATYHLNSQLSGTGIVTGLRYVNSEDQDEEWFAGAPFPVVHTHTYSFDLLSQSGADNYVMYVTMHETVDAMGVPTATVDRVATDCRG